MNIGYTCCAIPDHLVLAFCTSELRSTRVSIKLLPHYAFLENKLAKGKARNKHCPVNERKSMYISVHLNVFYGRVMVERCMHTISWVFPAIYSEDKLP